MLADFLTPSSHITNNRSLPQRSSYQPHHGRVHQVGNRKDTKICGGEFIHGVTIGMFWFVAVYDVG